MATIGRTHLYHAETLRSQPNSILNRDVDITEALNKAEEAFFKSLDVCERLAFGGYRFFVVILIKIALYFRLSTNEVGIRELAQMRGRLFLNLGLVIEQRGDLRNSISFIEKAISLHK